MIGSARWPGQHARIGMMSLNSPSVPPNASPPTDISAQGPAARPGDTMHHGLRVAAAYAWRLIVVAVAVFVGLVITALLRPLVDLLSRKLPRGLAVALTLLLTIVAIGGIFTFVADSV